MTVVVLTLLAVVAAWVHGRLTGWNAATKPRRDDAEVTRILGGVHEVWNAPTSQLQEVPVARPIVYEATVGNPLRPRAITAVIDRSLAGAQAVQLCAELNQQWWDDELGGAT